MFDYVVIGKGLIGSAAVRSLSQVCANVAIIGPDEPTDFASHDGVFASHYDQGRITRVLDEDLIWGTLAQRSIQTYPALEAESDIRFHYPVGAMRVGHLPEQQAYIDNNRAVGNQLGATFDTYVYPELAHRLPYCSFTPDVVALHETGGAGFINPRALIQAQLRIAETRGATLIPEIAKDLTLGGSSSHPRCRIRTREGQTYEARKVIIATGGFTNFFALVGRSLAWTVVAESILLAELTERSQRAIANLPSLMYRVPTTGGLLPTYLVPPVAYPDGRCYLKMGIGNQRHVVFDSLEAITAWFKTGPDAATHKLLQEALLTLLPDLELVSTQVKPCALTFTASNYPYIDVVEPERVFMAVGGCGYAGKLAVEIGYIAAQLAIHNGWAYDLDADYFKAIFRRD